MARTLHGLLDHTVRRGLPLGPDAEAMRDLVSPLDALRGLLHRGLRAASADAPGDDGLDAIDAVKIDPLHHLGGTAMEMPGVRLSLDEVFADGGFEEVGPRPFRRLVVEDLSNTFGMPKIVGRGGPSNEEFSLPLRDGSPAARAARAADTKAPRRIPSPEELLLDLRRGHDGTAVTMEGTTESLPIQTVFESLSASRKSGTLSIRTADESLVFELDHGDVVFAASDSTPPGDRLGDILLERGWLTPESLSAALDLQTATQERLGTALEREQLVTREQLRQALEEQIHRHFMRAFQTLYGAYSFAKGSSEDVDQRVRLTISRLLFESARLSDERARDRAPQGG